MTLQFWMSFTFWKLTAFLFEACFERQELTVFSSSHQSVLSARRTLFFSNGGLLKRNCRDSLPPNMFHIVTLNRVDSGNAVTLTCLPSFQAEVWPAALVVLRAWAQRSVRVGFPPPKRLDVQITRPCFVCCFFLFSVHRDFSFERISKCLLRQGQVLL